MKLSHFESETISIYVGPERKKFTIHIDTISAASSYIHAIISSRAQDTEGEPIELNEELYDAEAFSKFVQYCYFGDYLNIDQESNIHPLLLQAKIYTLAKKLECLPLKELALKKAEDWCHKHIAEPDNNGFDNIFPHIVHAIHVIYTYTDHVDHGSQPSSNSNEHEENTTLRDMFRLHLAHLAALHLLELRAQQGFLDAHHMFPDFSIDMLLFLDDRKTSAKGGTVSSAGKATLPTTQGSQVACDQDMLHLQKRAIMGFDSFVNAETFTVVVGKDRVRFHIHTTALGCSNYFQRLIASDMKEAREKTVLLDSGADDVEAFSKFSQFCYLQDYFYDADSTTSLLLHSKVYVLAEKLDCLPLKDLAFEKACLLVNSEMSNDPHQLFSAVQSAVGVVYKYTYHSKRGTLPYSVTEEHSIAQGEHATETTTLDPSRKRKRHDLEGAAEVVELPTEISGDKFRDLLAEFASKYLSSLRTVPSFMLTCHKFPEFAIDIMMLAEPGINQLLR
ncbi:hypothetical protein ABW21_db0203024 [Orbilia brochopaga]|nr:hypothetical protein ABW21_db0203024 [Drechslerella brochopaga]